jgi:hypothetical protein
MALGLALKLARAGYWQGDPGRIMQAPSDEVLAALQYEEFVAEYESATIELNREKAN